jgi:hypothetical protein
MPYGPEAKEELTKIVQGKCLRVLVYGEDQWGRCISDLYCNGKFVQVLFLSTLVSFLPVYNNELNYLSSLTLPGINAQERACMALRILRPTPRTCNSKKSYLLHSCIFLPVKPLFFKTMFVSFTVTKNKGKDKTSSQAL